MSSNIPTAIEAVDRDSLRIKVTVRQFLFLRMALKMALDFADLLTDLCTMGIDLPLDEDPRTADGLIGIRHLKAQFDTHHAVLFPATPEV